jgi:hypothetical protein
MQKTSENHGGIFPALCKERKLTDLKRVWDANDKQNHPRRSIPS